MRFGFLELVLILAMFLLIFGPKQIPKLVKVTKEAALEFKESAKKDEEANDDVEVIDEQKS